jgi:hypothetical protein
LLIVLVAIGASGCGGGSSATGSATSDQHAKSEPSAQFGGSPAADKFVEYGKESTPAELGQVNVVLEKSLDARAAKDWAGQCATLSRYAVEQAQKSLAAIWSKGCAPALEGLGSNASKSVLENNIQGAVVAFRVNGRRGYALYHGTDKKDWAMPMEKEGGDWKVGALLATEVPDAGGNQQ